MENRKINLGCGDKKLEGYLNVDISDRCHPDVVHDIRDVFPHDWKNIDRIEMDNIAEHIEATEFIRVVNNCWTILRKGGELWIRVPELREDNLMPCFSDPTHVNYFTDQTFGYYVESNPRYKNFGKDYGIIGWDKLDQVKNKIFLEVTLTK